MFESILSERFGTKKVKKNFLLSKNKKIPGIKKFRITVWQQYEWPGRDLQPLSIFGIFLLLPESWSNTGNCYGIPKRIMECSLQRSAGFAVIAKRYPKIVSLLLIRSRHSSLFYFTLILSFSCHIKPLRVLVSLTWLIAWLTLSTDISKYLFSCIF